MNASQASKCVNKLVLELPDLATAPEICAFTRKSVVDNTVAEIEDLLSFAARVLPNSRYTLSIARIFRKFLAEIVLRVCRLPVGTQPLSLEVAEKNTEALSRVVRFAPHVTDEVVRYISRGPTFLERVLRQQSKNEEDSNEVIKSFRSIARTAHRLLRTNLDRFGACLNWASLIHLISHKDLTVRWHSGCAVALLFRLEGHSQCKFLESLYNSKEEKILITSIEAEDQAEEAGIVKELEILYSIDERDEEKDITDKENTSEIETSPSLSHVGGVLLNRNVDEEKINVETGCQPATFVSTETSIRNIESFAAALCVASPLPLPILLEGPAGCGKSTLLREVARRLGQDRMIEVHLDEQVDSKSLLGNYVCADTPGEFKWQAGVLTRAVQEGLWLVIEDVDRTPAEVLTTLLPLLETGQLSLAGRGEVIEAHPNFRLLGTRTSSYRKPRKVSIDKESINIENEADRLEGEECPPSGITGAVGALLENVWLRVPVNAPTKDELLAVLQSRYRELPTYLLNKILETFHQLAEEGRRKTKETKETKENKSRAFSVEKMDIDEASSGATRPISQWIERQSRRILHLWRQPTARDLFRWCDRISAVVDLQDHDGREFLTLKECSDVVQEAIDVFCAGLMDIEARFGLAKAIADQWNVPSSTTLHFLNQSKPEVKHCASGDFVDVGRVTLPIIISEGRKLNAKTSTGQHGQVALTGHTLRLMERLAVCVRMQEPALLVGETGAGKTTIIQHLARCCGQTLVVHNLNMQTESADLIGGFKPVDIRQLALPVYQQFISLFPRKFSRSANTKFLSAMQRAFEKQKWKVVCSGFKSAVGMAKKKKAQQSKETKASRADPRLKNLENEWQRFERSVVQLMKQREQVEQGFAFSFVEGPLVEALQRGHWMLLDEVNLASGETLQRLTGLLDSDEGSLILTERGDIVPLKRNPHFRLFSAMNPATGVGKKDLPPALRQRFAEIFVDEMTAAEDLEVVVRPFFADIPPSIAPTADVVKFYIEARKMSQELLQTGQGKRPRFSLRTLCRALRFARNAMGLRYPLERALFEGLNMAFLTQLDVSSQMHMKIQIRKCCGKRLTAESVKRPPPKPLPEDPISVLCTNYYVECGGMEPRDTSKSGADGSPAEFVVTPSVRRHLEAIARAAVWRQCPVLLQGPTSSGKTSIVRYLAALTGHKCVRINNHEHTDLQEYMGCYASDMRGRLVFHEGPLVTAVRKGHWVVLDELNLAPSEVLEALNRLLDDNRELLIAETGEIVKPHPHFMLFATQNPPGLYGGRKELSTAFRNRFLEMEVGDIPAVEMETILKERTALAPSFCKRLVKVQIELSKRRNSSSIFQGKQSFITPRDLLKWAGRNPLTAQELAEEGYMLLAERLRRPEEKKVVKQVLERCCRGQKPVSINPSKMYGLDDRTPPAVAAAAAVVCEEQCEIENAKDPSTVAWTRATRRMYALVRRCLDHSEPVLLVGATAAGKTTVCQVLSHLLCRRLHIINCHQHTDTADIVGGLRPVRAREKIGILLVNAVEKLLVELKTTLQGEKNLQITIPSSVGKSLDPDEAISLYDCCANAIKYFTSQYTTLRKELDIAAAQEDRDRRLLKDEERQQKQLLEKSRFATLTRIVSTSKEVAALLKRYRALFEWGDGPLLHAMRNGELLLLDELNTADDAVLERLNSVLEPGRSILLSEKGGDGLKGTERVVAVPNFRVLATMNPSGDYGKRELSPALRNRFTEIWVPPVTNPHDLLCIAEHHTERLSCQSLVSPFTSRIVNFIVWFNENVAQGRNGGFGRLSLTLRDMLCWLSFIDTCAVMPSKSVQDSSRWNSGGNWQSYAHGAAMVVLDSMAAGTGRSIVETREMRKRALDHLLDQAPASLREKMLIAAASNAPPLEHAVRTSERSERGGKMLSGLCFGCAPFYIPRGPLAPLSTKDPKFAFMAPTTCRNLLRLLRAMQLSRPLLLEGSPGVGKTSLVSALAKASGHRVTRINLSEQTDLADLFGSDLPMPSSSDASERSERGGNEEEKKSSGGGRFRWCDGAFLRALRNGDWVILDELNLAPQTVLEGLNAVLDHRATVYIPQIDRSFKCPSTFRVFACQNPLQEGGGRKGLPKSFLNRFTRVWVDTLEKEDLLFITRALYPQLGNRSERSERVSVGEREGEVRSERSERGTLSEAMDSSRTVLEAMIDFNTAIQEDTMVKRMYGLDGSPWEFNLRDVFRWCDLLTREQSRGTGWDPLRYVDLLYASRFRQENDRKIVRARAAHFFARAVSSSAPKLFVGPHFVSIGRATILRGGRSERGIDGGTDVSMQHFPHTLLSSLEMVAMCVAHRWPAMIVGPPSSGKSVLLEQLAKLAGRHLRRIPMSSGVDASELLGCFEQAEPNRRLRRLLGKIFSLTRDVCSLLLVEEKDGRKKSRVTNLLHVEWLLRSELRNERSEGGTSERSEGGINAGTMKQLLDLLSDIADTSKRSERGIHSPEIGPRVLKRLKSVQDEWHTFRKRQERLKNERGCFEWVDGGLVQAIETGEWIVLDNVNLCNPSVLDRLNSLLEPGGELLINESGPDPITGELRIVKPHPDFRLFCTMDPARGEVSRAFRNRCIEVCVNTSERSERGLYASELHTIELHTSERSERGIHASSTLTRIHSSYLPSKDDLFRVIASAGVIGGGPIPRTMVKLHELSYIDAENNMYRLPSPRHLHRWALLLHQQRIRGVALEKAIRRGFIMVYRPSASLLQWLRVELNTSERSIHSLEVGLWPTPLVGSGALHTVEERLSIAYSAPMRIIWHLMLMKESVTDQVDELLSVAVRHFADAASIADWRARIRFMDGLVASFARESHLYPIAASVAARVKTLLSSRFESALSKTYREARSTLCRRLSTSEHGREEEWSLMESLDYTPLSLPVDTIDGMRYIVGEALLAGDSRAEAEWSTLCRLYHWYTFYCKRTAQYIKENLTKKEAERRVRTNNCSKKMTLLQVAHLFDGRLVNRSMLSHPFGEFLIPFLRAVDGLAKRFFDEMGRVNRVSVANEEKSWNNISDLLECRDEMAHCLDAPDLQKTTGVLPISAVVQLTWEKTYKAVEAMRAANRVSVANEEKLDDLFYLGKRAEDAIFPQGRSGLRDTLWKVGGHPFVRSGRIADALQQLSKYASRIEYQSRGERTQLYFFADKRLREMMVDAISTKRVSCRVSVANEEKSWKKVSWKEEGEDLVTSCVEAALAAAVEKQEARKKEMIVMREDDDDASNEEKEEGEEKTILLPTQDLQHRWALAEMGPIVDIGIASQELGLLGQLVHAMNRRVYEKDLRDKVHSFTTLMIENGTRSPSDAALWREIQWRLDSSSTVDFDLGANIHELLMRWHLNHWRGSFNYQVPNLNEMASERSERGKGSGGEDLLVGLTGPARIGKQGEAILHLLQRVVGSPCADGTLPIRAPISTRRAKLSQLKALCRECRNTGGVEETEEEGKRLLFQLLQHTLCCFRENFGEEDWKVIERVTSEQMSEQTSERSERGGNVLDKNLEDLERCLAACTDCRIVKCAQDYIIPCFRACTEKDYPQGKGWISLGLARFELLLPTVARDPAAEDAFQVWNARRKTKEARVELQVAALCARANGDNADLKKLGEKVADAAETQAVLEATAVMRPEDADFEQLYRELHQFREQFMNRERVSVANEVGMCVEEEEIWQEATSTFVERMLKCRSFPDVTIPILAAIMQVKHGMRMLRTSERRERGGNVLSALLQFPHPGNDLEAVSMIVDTAEGEENFNVKQGLLQAGLAQLYASFITNMRTSELMKELFQRIFTQYLKIWNDAEEAAARRRAEEAATVQYKEKETKVKTDEELEEEALREAFPDYHGMFEDRVSAANEGQVSVAKKKFSCFTLSKSTIEHLFQTHALLFHRNVHSADNAADAHRRAFSFSYNAAGTLMNQEGHKHCSSKHTAGGHLMAAGSIAKQLEAADDSVDKYDFQQTSNVAEVQLCQEPLETFIQRIRTLLQQWPGNAMLHLLLRIALRITHIPLSAPVVQVLVGIETLLAKAEKWEAYASKTVSLGKELKPLMLLVKRWRKLELKSWPSLLEKVNKQCETNCYKWWFHLYQTIRRVGQVGQVSVVSEDQGSAANEEDSWKVSRKEDWRRLPHHCTWLMKKGGGCAPPKGTFVYEEDEEEKKEEKKEKKPDRSLEDHHLLNTQEKRKEKNRKMAQAAKKNKRKEETLLKELVDILDSFLRGSTLGEFETRMGLLARFERQCRWEQGETRVAAILGNTVRLYGQFLPQTRKVNKECKTPLEKKLKDHAKLAKWDDRTYFAMKESAEKSHRALHKIMTEYKHELEKPVQGVMDQNVTTVDLAEGGSSSFLKGKGFEIGAFIDRPVDGNDYLARNVSLRKKMIQKIKKQWTGEERIKRAEGVEQLAKIIIERVVALQKPNVQQTMKRRALADLFKNLEKQGLIWLARAIPQSQKNIRAILELPMPNVESIFNLEMEKAWKRGEKYYYRCLARLQRVRISAGQKFSEDLGKSDVKKGVGYCEHLTFLMMQQRQLLHALNKDYKALKKEEVEEEEDESGKKVRIQAKLLVDTLGLECNLDDLSEISANKAFPPAVVDVIAQAAKRKQVKKEKATVKMDREKENKAIETILIAIQNLSKIQQGSKVIEDHKFHLQAVKALNMRAIINAMTESPQVAQFRDIIRALLKAIAEEILTLHGGLCKLNYILLNTMQVLMEKGFCKPPPADDDEAEGEEGEMGDGTGMGDGEGAEDVSNEIEDASQLEGLQGNEDEKEGEKRPEGEEGMEMENDFDGTMCDVEEKEEEKEDSEAEEDEMDREMGSEDDENMDVVDEKEWQSEEEEETEKEEKKEEKFEENSPMSGKDEGEMRAAEEEEEEGEEGDEGEKGEKKEEEKREVEKEEEEKMEEEKMEEDFLNEDLEENYEENNLIPPEQDDGEFELPDDLKLEGEEGEEEKGEEEGEKEGEEEEKGEEEGEEEEKEEEEEGEKEEEKEGDVVEAERLEEEESLAMEDTVKAPLEDENEKETDKEKEEKEKEETETEKGKEEKTEGGMDAAEEGAGGTEETKEKESTPKPKPSEEVTEEEETEKEEIQSSEQKEKDVEGDWMEDNQDQEGEKAGTKDKEDGEGEDGAPKEQPNPLNDPSAALEHWKRNLKNLLEEKDESEEIPKDTETDGAEDYSIDNSSAKEVLAAAEEEMELQTIEIDEKEEAKETDEEKKREEEKEEKKGGGKKEEKRKEKGKREKTEKEEVEEVGEEMEEVEASDKPKDDPEDVIPRKSEFFLAEETEMELEEEEEGMGMEKGETLAAQDFALWRQFQAETSQGSQRLSEQLRLILAPMLATRLKGDYKSGKRINMRKVIEFIASSYRKDKIWLRRNLPAKRNYQIVIALDDSLSMAPVASFALSSIATIAQAMTSLEAGEISIVKFGEKPQLLLPFTEPFSDDSASRVLSSFEFQSEESNFSAAVSSITSLLKASRANQQVSSNVRIICSQLCFILSDGLINESREAVKQRVQYAKEAGQLLLLVIIDNSQQSIYDIKSVSMKNGRVTMKAYLDEYPFDFYLVVQNPAELPEILSDALRQWFQVMSS